ncbi:T9SS type A sorting domain-containing protein [Gaetbulibacter sp. PBL-D1]|uniref:T9SS type A sorting domain-containing protein n=1 Tax=Gaetbulibacter sp. PBL-D1 TaxID=3422594 RepID=UPI003D2F45BD
MKKIYISLVFSVFMMTSWSQEYKRMMDAGTYTVEEIIAEAEAYFAIEGTGQGKGYKPYKRWEYQALRNMDENGMLKTPEFYFEELENYNNYINQNSGLARTTVGTWEQLGPTNWNQTSGWNPGVGRVTSIAVDASNSNHIIAGANSGGVWKTLDGGATWEVLTDNMSNLYVYALAIDPNDSSTYYWGTTSGNIFKSTDAGATWNFWSDTGNGSVNKIIIDPANSNKMYCSVQSGGIFKSSNAGANWTLINESATNGYDVEFKPGDSNTIYASGQGVFVSTDGGANFSEITGVFSNGPKMIGVSANSPSTVYVIEASGSAFGSLYKSTDSAVTFSELDHDGKNYFGYSSDPEDPSDVGSGQAPRDMDITVNPADANEVHIAGINTWRSLDGGVSFNISSQWIPQNAAAQGIGYCHADVDILEFVGDKLYAGTDGGIYVANNPSSALTANFYTDLSAGMSIKQFYKFGITQSDPVIISGGSQDNGTSAYLANGDWIDWLGADGMESFVDKNNSNIMYGTSQFGTTYKTINGGSNISNLVKPDGKGGQNFYNWVVPFEQDPLVQNTIYIAFDEVYMSTNGGTSWTSVSQNFGANIDNLKVAPSNSSYMYLSINGNLYKNTFVGIVNSWSQLSGFSGSVNSIAIHPTDPNKVAIATTSTQKVYVSSNGGITWTPYGFDLPNFSAQALTWHDNGEDGLYLGMNYGVYYIDNTTGNSWQPFSNNLPNVIISELEINTVENKIYAATYGRGVWRSNLYDASLSVSEFDLQSLNMYPNPAKTQINLRWDKGDNVSIRIYNSIGKLMYYAKDENLLDTYTIDVAQYASGLYFVKVNTLNGVVTKKLIIE